MEAEIDLDRGLKDNPIRQNSILKSKPESQSIPIVGAL